MAKPRKIAKRASNRGQRRLAPDRHTIAKQSAAVLALGLGLAAVAPAEADIVYTNLGPAGQTIFNGYLEFLNYPGAGNMFMVGHYGYTDPPYAAHRSAIGYNFNNYTNSSIAVSYNNYNYASKLNRGAKISGALSWYGYGKLAQSYTNINGTYKYGSFLGQKGYVGLQFDPGDGTHYGWAEISAPDDATSVTLYGYAYETWVDQEINAGQVPLPSSLLLLASGAAGLLAYRRMRRAG